MDIQSALDKLYSMHQFSIKLGLDRIENLLDHLGNPHKNLNCFHIAGSNGKGSTASFIASVLMEAGFRVGLYTSPHFVRFNERIKINGNEIEDSYIAGFIESLQDYIENNEATFFEVTTALAFNYFNEADLDFVVVETGLGGRLDATNIIKPLTSVITSISLEHTYILGSTIEKIAVEKAGIIKPNSIVLSGLMPDEAEDIIAAKALGMNCTYYKVRDFMKMDDDYISVQLGKKLFNIYSTPLPGYHQLINASLAVRSVYDVIGMTDGELLSNGIKKVVDNTGIQGRYEIFSERPKIIFDSAHNPESVRIFIDEFSKEYSYYSETVLVFGSMRDKDIREMLNILSPYFNNIYISQVDIERAATIEEIMEIGNKVANKLVPLENPAEFVQKFRTGNLNRCLVALGSIYLVGEIKSKIIDKKA